MPTDYDSIAEEYKESKDADWRVHIEAYSFMHLLGDVSGLSVLDLACGEGFYSRKIMEAGAARVLGVDNSPAMIALARSAESAKRLGVEYLVADVKGLDLGEQFDLVTAAFILNYASTPDELLEMCRAIARHLKPGRRFVTVNSNPAIGSRKVDYRKYGFERIVPDDLGEGSPYVYRNFQDDTSFDITIYQLAQSTHDDAFARAGLCDVRWLDPRVSPEGAALFEAGYWDTFLQNPPVILIECRVAP